MLMEPAAASMFSGATAFNQNAGAWNTARVANMNISQAPVRMRDWPDSQRPITQTQMAQPPCGASESLPWHLIAHTADGGPSPLLEDPRWASRHELMGLSVD